MEKCLTKQGLFGILIKPSSEGLTGRAERAGSDRKGAGEQELEGTVLENDIEKNEEKEQSDSEERNAV